MKTSSVSFILDSSSITLTIGSSLGRERETAIGTRPIIPSARLRNMNGTRGDPAPPVRSSVIIVMLGNRRIS